MDHPLIDLISAQIREAEARGEFDNLPGAGKPLPRVENPGDAVFDRIMKENGAVPEPVAVSRELTRLREELRETGDRTRRADIVKEMSLLEARLEMARRR